MACAATLLQHLSAGLKVSDALWHVDLAADRSRAGHNGHHASMKHCAALVHWLAAASMKHCLSGRSGSTHLWNAAALQQPKLDTVLSDNGLNHSLHQQRQWDLPQCPSRKPPAELTPSAPTTRLPCADLPSLNLAVTWSAGPFSMPSNLELNSTGIPCLR